MKRWAIAVAVAMLPLLVACGSDPKVAAGTNPTSAKQGEVQGEARSSICGTGEDPRPTPSGIAELDAASGRIAGAGSSFVAPLMTVWSGEFQNASGAKVAYQSVGSGAGVERISAGTVDFGASDAPMSDTELAAAEGGSILHVPLVFGAVVPAYHLTGQKAPLKFTGDVLGKIFAGQITRWNDAELTALNPGSSLPNEPIRVAHRLDSSGTTAIFTEYLTKASPAWVEALGGTDKSAGKTVVWPIGNAGKGNEGVSALIKQTEGALGYVELTYALSNGLNVGSVKNKAGNFIEPCVETVTAAARDIAIPEDLRFSLTDTPGTNAYPITGTVWALVYEEQTDLAKANTLVNFLVWALDEGQTKARSHYYAPLSPELRSLAIDQVKKITVNGKALAQ
jgi:phosphate transport system substrate-binding protein